MLRTAFRASTGHRRRGIGHVVAFTQLAPDVVEVGDEVIAWVAAGGRKAEFGIGSAGDRRISLRESSDPGKGELGPVL